MPFLRKYGAGTGADVIVPMIVAGETNHAVAADWTPQSGDVKVSKDGAAAANVGTLPTYITSVGWKFVFSDAELQCARLSVQVTDSATKAVEDQHFVVETYGHASAQHAFDLDTALQSVNTTQISGSSTAANNAEVVFDTDFSTNYNTTRDAWVTNVQDTVGTGNLPADAVAISGDSTAADNLEAAFDGTGYDVGGIDVSAINTAATAVGSDGSGLTEAGGDGDHLTSLATAAALATVGGNVDTLLTRITSTLFDGITSLAEWLGLLAGKQTGDSTARTELRATGAGSGSFDETTDSIEAIRDTAPLGSAMRGTDSASTHSAADVWSVATRVLTANTNLNDPTVNAIADAILGRDASGSTTNSTLGAIVNDLEDGGRLDLLVDAMKAVTDALTAAAAAKLAISAGTIVTGTVSTATTSPTTTVFAAGDITEATGDHFQDRTIIFTSGALALQGADIEGYALVSGEGKFTVTAMTEAPADNDTFMIV